MTTVDSEYYGNNALNGKKYGKVIIPRPNGKEIRQYYGKNALNGKKYGKVIISVQNGKELSEDIEYAMKELYKEKAKSRRGLQNKARLRKVTRDAKELFLRKRDLSGITPIIQAVAIIDAGFVARDPPRLIFGSSSWEHMTYSNDYDLMEELVFTNCSTKSHAAAEASETILNYTKRARKDAIFCSLKAGVNPSWETTSNNLLIYFVGGGNLFDPSPYDLEYWRQELGKEVIQTGDLDKAFRKICHRLRVVRWTQT